MKILHLNINYITSNLHYELLNKFNSYGVCSDVFVALSNKNKFKIMQKDKILIKQVPCYHSYLRYIFFYKQIQLFKTIQFHFDIKNYDCIHAHTLFNDGYLAFRLYRKYKIPYIITIRDGDINVFLKYKPYLKKSAKKILECSEKILVYSKSYKDKIIKLLNIDEKSISNKVHFIKNGINDFWIENRIKKNRNIEINSKINIISVGIICKRKNQLGTMEMCKILNRLGYEVNLWLVGKVRDYKIFKKLENETFVTYHGIMNKEELLELYRESHILVLPSLTETFGLVYAEAMSQSLPIIYTKEEGFDGQFEDGRVGYSVRPHNYSEIANKCVKILEKYEAISENCYLLSNQFQWDYIVRDYLSMYTEILQKEMF